MKELCDQQDAAGNHDFVSPGFRQRIIKHTQAD
jgi:hypothetical protein